ncbi:site-specific DNA-methyltransferase [Neobacillus sp. YIM B02564]|uniref:Methyltransferase n=1 Tax=Neobacillus paridis TaxID=2803862 RepID=A0ABS1TK16_9BACI|nr:site-specific DNA-methyltransferase [Neobacillus paridis]MBL4951104.1 site-specific DNA-methyltransferase [Neobacillus paridis]
MVEINKIILTDAIPSIRSIESDSIDLIVTDPPYFVQAQGTGGGKNKWNGGSRFKGGNSVFGVENSQDKLFNYVNEKDYMSEFSRIINPSGHIYIFTNDKNLTRMINEAEKHKLKLMNILVVDKIQGTYFSYYQKQVEFILFFRSTKGKAKYINNCGMGNLFQYRYTRGKDKLHPSEKPLELIEKLILQSSNEGDIIFDPFAGSGTTAIACAKNNRNFICYELEEKYVNIANKRLKNYGYSE